MATTYALLTIEAEDGTEHPDEALWTPASPEAEKHAGFLNHNGMLLTGVGREGELPDEFVAIGHGHTWTAIYQAATTYMRQFYEADLAADPEARTPLPERRHAVFIRHPHPDHPCGCEWEGTWRLVYVEPTEPGAVAVTVMKRPGGAS
jgi:hypothetical protein